MRKYQRTALLTLSSALLAVAPKCPVCFLAYFGIFGVATASASVYRAWLPPLTAIWLTLTVAMLALRTDGKPKYGPIALGFGAALSVFAGRFIVANQMLLYAGLVALVVATVWSVRSRTSAERVSCSQCEPHTRLTGPGTPAGS